jgi:hypothetical protein
MIKNAWVALLCAATTAGAVAQTSPATPAADAVSPQMEQPDATRQAQAAQPAQPAQPARPDAMMDMNDPRMRSEMSQCTSGPRDERAECVRNLRGGSAAEPGEGRAMPGQGMPMQPGQGGAMHGGQPGMMHDGQQRMPMHDNPQGGMRAPRQ